MSGHALLSPSAASRWVACPASLRASKGIENKSSGYADEGKFAHDIAEKTLKGDKIKVEISEEMTEAVETYVCTVRSMSEGAIYTDVEAKLNLSDMIGQQDTWGTADFVAIMPDNTLQVHDLKYGKGVGVVAEGNWQLIIYGLGVLELVEMIGYEIESVHLVIHQPRLGYVSEVIYTVAEMREFQQEIRKAAAVAVSIYDTDAEPPLSMYCPDEKACRWCPAKGVCEALADHCLKTIIGDFDEIPESIVEDVTAAKSSVGMSTEERIASVLDAADLISDWLTAVRERALELLRQGVPVPRYKLVMGRAGNRAWGDESAAESIMKTLDLKDDDIYKKKLISPTEAEKILKKQPQKWGRLEEQVTRSAPQPTIAPESDKRPPVSVKPVADDFDDIA